MASIKVRVLKETSDFCLNFLLINPQISIFNAIWQIIIDFLGKLLSKSEGVFG